MTQAYSNPECEDDPYSLPNVEVFYNDPHPGPGFSCGFRDENGTLMPEGWYWWTGFPGRDGDPIGPYASEAEALSDAQQT
jgi:hypothetical protein